MFFQNLTNVLQRGEVLIAKVIEKELRILGILKIVRSFTKPNRKGFVVLVPSIDSRRESVFGDFHRNIAIVGKGLWKFDAEATDHCAELIRLLSSAGRLRKEDASDD